MRISALIYVTAFASSAAFAADAPTCHFKSPIAVVCGSPAAAATAFNAFGFDFDKAAISYNSALLRQIGCGGESSVGGRNSALVVGRSEQVATPTGWVEVAAVKTDEGSYVWTSRKYLLGNCMEPKLPISRPIKAERGLGQGG